MKFNVKKCKVLRVTKKTTNLVKFDYTMSATEQSQDYVPTSENIALANSTLTCKPKYLIPLEEISSDRYLGVHLDNHLTFNFHITESIKKATNVTRRDEMSRIAQNLFSSKLSKTVEGGEFFSFHFFT